MSLADQSLISQAPSKTCRKNYGNGKSKQLQHDTKRQPRFRYSSHIPDRCIQPPSQDKTTKTEVSRNPSLQYPNNLLPNPHPYPTNPPHPSKLPNIHKNILLLLLLLHNLNPPSPPHPPPRSQSQPHSPPTPSPPLPSSTSSQAPNPASAHYKHPAPHSPPPPPSSPRSSKP